MRIFNPLIIAAILLPGVRAATLTGRIVEDHSGSAAPSASVRVYRIGMRGLAADLETDGNGRFHAPGLPEGDYRIEVSKPNYVEASLRLQLAADGETPLLVRLVRCAVITGRATDSNGQPVRGAHILAMSRAAAGQPLRPEFRHGRFATADEQGRYRIFNLPPGQYFIALSYGASTFAVGSTGTAATAPRLGSGVLFYPANSGPQTFTVNGGEQFNNVDFAVFPAAHHSVSGKVEFSSEQLERGQFWLALAPIGQPALALAVTQTEKDGSFRFNGVPTGAYHLFASGPSLGRSGRGASINPDSQFARTRVEIGSHNQENISIAPAKGRSVTFAFRPADPRCASNAELVLAPLEDWAAQLERRMPVTLSKEQIVPGLAPARYLVSLSGLGETCYVPDGTVLDLSSADPSPFPVPVHSSGAIHGRLDPGERTPAEFVIVLFSDLTDAGRPVQVVFPDAQSRFTFNALRPGRYRIVAQPASGEFQSRWLAGGTRSVDIDVPGGAPIQITLSAPRADSQ